MANALITNPELAWDGKTTIQYGKPVERPVGWQIAVALVEGGSPPIFHDERDDKGLKIDPSFSKCDVTIGQSVTLPAGTSYAVIDCESHHVWGNDPHTIRWNVEVLVEGKLYESADIWVGREKGLRRWYVPIENPEETAADLRFRYRTKWADVYGEMRVNRLDLVRQKPESYPAHTPIQIGTTVDMPPVPPTLPPDDKVDLWKALVPDDTHVHELSSGELIFSETLANRTHLIRKNKHWEHVWLETIDGTEYIVRGADDSAYHQTQTALYIPCRGNYYGEQGSQYGHLWLPRYMKVGDVFTSQAYLTYYRRNEKIEIGPRGILDNEYRFVEVIPAWRGLENVVKVEWWHAGKLQETFYLRNGYVGWGAPTVRNEYIGERELSQVAARQVLEPYKRWFNPEEDIEQGGGTEIPVITIPEGTRYQRVKLEGGDLNVRSQPAGVRTNILKAGSEIEIAIGVNHRAPYLGTEYLWKAIKWTDSTGADRQGWVAELQHIRFVPVEDEGNEGDSTEIANLRKDVETLAEQVNQLKALPDLIDTLEKRVDAMNGALVLSENQIKEAAEAFRKIEEGVSAWRVILAGAVETVEIKN